jgi:hypothetical protein
MGSHLTSDDFLEQRRKDKELEDQPTPSSAAPLKVWAQPL